LAAVLLAFFLLAAGSGAAADKESPSVALGELYRAVELTDLFADQKTFADAIPKLPPAEIRLAYERQKQQPGFSLKGFIARYFVLPERKSVALDGQTAKNINAYIAAGWTLRQRPPDRGEIHSSLLPFSHPYVVPGGRFREVYYWDSYFTMLGLEQGGRHALVRDMLANFATLIEHYGHIPNGNRSYYLSRSQPPFFAAMIELAAKLMAEYPAQTAAAIQTAP